MSRQFYISLLAVILVTGLSLGCSSTRSVSSTPMFSLLPAQNETRAVTIREWNEWADAHLQNGDIIFMRGDCYMLMGTVNFSELSTDLTASRFSHIGLVAIEDRRAYVYDIRNQGCLRTRFGELLANRQLHQVAVKRHHDASSDDLEATAAFCRAVYGRREKYDDQLKLSNGRLYCTELVEEAYRSAGYRLSEPVAIEELPNYGRHLKTIQFVRAVTSIEPDQLVLLPGNERIGVWANPALGLVLDLQDTRLRPDLDGSGDPSCKTPPPTPSK